MSMLSLQLPSQAMLATLEPEAQMRKIHGYLYQLTEQLRYVLDNLDTENFVTATAQKIQQAADAAATSQAIADTQVKTQADFQKSLAAIIEAADTVTANYFADMQVMQNAIQSDVRANYALKDELEAHQLELTSRITQTATDLTAAFSRVLQLEDAVGGFSNEVFSTFIRFDADGIELGRSDSDFRCRLTNERLCFLQGANQIAYVSNHRLHISDAVIGGTLSLGNDAVGYYDWQREPNGSLSLVFHT